MIPNRSTLAGVLLALATPTACGQPEDAKPPDLPTSPQVHLVPSGEPDKDATDARVDRLTAQADATPEPAARCGLLLAAANEILAHQLAPACTAKFLGIEDGEIPPDEEIRKTLDRADALLDKADAGLLADVPTEKLETREADAKAPDVPSRPSADEGSKPPDVLPKLRLRLETLRAFSQALRTFLLPQEPPDAGGLPQSVASRLSPLLEDRNAQVAAAATFWQACLRKRTDDPSRVMPLLPPALRDLPRQTLPFGLYARLLRCSLLAAPGGHAAALALLTQMEERCDAWFPNDAQRDDAIRAITLLQIQILGDWYRHMPETTDPAAPQWCVDRINAFKTDRFPDDNQTILQLTPAIPLITEPPEPQDGLLETDPSAK